MKWGKNETKLKTKYITEKFIGGEKKINRGK